MQTFRHHFQQVCTALLWICLLLPASYGWAQPGSTCATAIAIAENSCGTQVIDGTTLSGLAYCGEDIPQREKWFSFTASSTDELAIRFNNPSGPGYMLLYSGTCGGPPIVENCTFLVINSDLQIIFSNPIPGNTYYIRLLTTDAFSPEVTGELCIFREAPNTCAAATNFSVGTCNQLFMVSGAGNPAADNCLGISESQYEGWATFTATNNGIITVRHTNFSGQTAKVLVYEGNCATPIFIDCATHVGEGTVTLPITAVGGQTYFIRVANTDPFDKYLSGTLCITNGAPPNGDLCEEAQSIAVGTCDFLVEVASNFVNNQGLPNPCGIAQVYQDRWLSFTTTEGNLRLGAEISKLDNDAALAVYASPSANCNDLNLLACTDASSGTGDELLEFDALAPGTYFIRLMNVANANILNGEFCLFEVVSRSNCADLAAAPAVSVGDCNLPVNVFANYPTTSDVPGTCVDETSPSAWVKFEPSASELVTINYLSTSGGPRPGLVVYENPAACGSLPTPLVCQNLTAGQGNDITLSFTVSAGSTYYFNIVNNGPPADMRGSLCVYAGSAPAGTFYTAAPVAIDGTACPLPFNVLSGLLLGTETDNENGLNNAPLVDPGCPAGTPQWDAWASFVITAPLPEPIIIQYDNNNGNGSQADNAALYVYKGENITTLNTGLTDYFREDCNTTLSDGTLTPMVLNQKLVGISVVGNTPSVPANPYTGLPCTTGTLRDDIWLRYTPAANEPFLVAFSNANQNVGIEVYNGCNTQISNGCANQYADFRDESVVVDGLAGNNYLIRIKNFGGADLTGDVGVYSLIEKIACADILAEGTEAITLDASLPGYEINKTYYIRVANVDNDNSLAGSLCILNEFKIQGDLCSTALGFIEGDCGKNFPITTDFKDIQANVDKPACLGAKNIGEDGWAVFTASSNSTTIEYANTDGNDVALAVYRGSCGNDQFSSTLTLANCADALGLVNGVESIEVNTIPGLQYFVRVIVIAPNTTLTGRICIRETSQTNVCDKSEMQTLFVSDCNVRFDVPANFTNDGVNLRDIVGNVFPPHQTGANPPVSPQFVCDIDLTNAGGTPTPARDAWIRLIGTGRVMTLQYQNNSEPGLEASNPALVVYAPLLSVGPLNCGTGINGAGNENAGNEFACVDLFDNTNKQTETVSFLSQAGQIYFVRVLDLAPAAPGSRGMTGLMCVSDGDQSYNTCADTLSVEIGDCNVAVNISNGINTFDGPNLPDCEDSDAGANPIAGFNDAWIVVRTPTGPLPDDEITIQYDNRTGSLAPVTDIALAVYTIADCNDFGTYTLVGCSDFLKTPGGIAEEGIESLTFPINQATGGETYYARIINKSTTSTAFGDVCVFYGADIAEATCSDASDYGELNGEWRGFEVLGDWTTDRDQPTDEIPPCVIPGGSNPTSFDPPIRSHGWFRFTVPDFEPAIEFVTIQFDNDNFIPGNPENAAIAVYSSPSGVQGVNVNCGVANYNGGGPSGYDPRTFANPGLYSNPNGMYFLDCANFVWEGTESLTIPVLENRTYYVRVMNIANRVDPDNMPGRVRVFPFARCVEGPNLIVDETFANWGAMTITGPLTNYSDVNTNLTHPNPRFSRYQDAPGAGEVHITNIARFATSYGYQRDLAPDGTADAVYNIHGNLNGRKNEMNAEGRYSVGHTIHTYKGNWFCYGRGFSGYGGHTQTSGTTWQAVYCATGGLGDGSEACDIICYENSEGTCNSFSIGEFGQPTANFPALVPTTAEANFFMVNGLFVEEAQQPAKVWCQTLRRSVPGSVGYYVFRGWFQNVKSGGQSGDVPQIRITVCDMEDPLTKIIPDATITPVTPDTPLPGTTRTPDPAGPTIHVPTPVENPVNMDATTLGDMTLAAGGAAGTRYEYGAAMPCNAPGEAPNARLKVLGSSFYLEQEPDQWQLMRCIYRAPAGISEFNLCVENESLTKNGNDFAMDDLELRECENADAAAFDRLLRGDPCELADDGEALGSSALNVSLLDFAGTLLGDKVVLNWLVAQENDLSHYEIERSLNGQTFSFLGQKDPSQSNGAEFKEYFYQDVLLPEGTNYLYYRLKMVKTNGGASHSGIIRIDVRNLQVLPIRLAPNPVEAGETATLRFEASEGQAQIVISDMMGRILHQSTFITSEGNQEIALETEGLPAGLYVIRIQQGARRNSIKLVVK